MTVEHYFATALARVLHARHPEFAFQVGGPIERPTGDHGAGGDHSHSVPSQARPLDPHDAEGGEQDRAPEGSR